MFSPIVSSASYPTISVAVTRRMDQEDRIDLMRFLFTGPTKIAGNRNQGDIGVADDWLEGDSEVSVPELVADLDDSFLGLDLDIAEQGKEATAVGGMVTEGDRIDQEQGIGFTEEARESEVEDNEEKWALPQAQGATSLTVKSLTLYRQLGAGGFGRVYGATLKGSNELHAVKVIPKTQDNENQALREQDLLRRLMGCPLFPRLDASWQSSLNYYLVTVCDVLSSPSIPRFIHFTALFVISRYTPETLEMKSTDSVALPSKSLISTSNKFLELSIISTPITSFTGTSNSKIFF